MTKHRIFSVSVASVYPLYVAKAEKKGRTKDEVDQVVCWLTGYAPSALQRQLDQDTDFRTFFAQAPAIHPNAALITAPEARDAELLKKLDAVAGRVLRR